MPVTWLTGSPTAGDGVAQLNAGAGQLADGLDQVAAKVPDAVDGANQLKTGSKKLATGADQLADGLQNQLAPGAVQLSDGLAGLQAAVDGSGQIADGLGQAKAGNVKIVVGAGTRPPGTKKLVQAGDETSKEFGKVRRDAGPQCQGCGQLDALRSTQGVRRQPWQPTRHSRSSRSARRAAWAMPGVAWSACLVLGLGALAATLVRGRFS